MATEKHTHQGTLFEASEIPLLDEPLKIRPTPHLTPTAPEGDLRGEHFQMRLRRHNPWNERILFIIKAGIARLSGRSIRRD